MKSRVVILFLMIFVLWTLLLSRAVWLQIIPNEKLHRLNQKQFATTLKVESRRGAILDREGREMAITVGTRSLFADPFLIKNPRNLAEKLHRILGLPRKELVKKLKASNRRFIWIQRHLAPDQVAQIRALKNRGLGFVEEPKRMYPKQTLSSQTLGFVGREGRGLEGVELAWDHHLRGQSRRIMVPRDARGRPLLNDARTILDVPDGNDLKLTIDSDLQFALESELMAAVHHHQARGASGVVMDPFTGEVLAMANMPHYDLNKALQTPRELRRNRAIIDSFEPGSTMKTFVIAAALKEGLIKPSTIIDCENGRLKVGDKWIREASESHNQGKISVTEVLAQSSNIGVAKIAFRLGDRKLRQALEDFGFGHRLNVGFQGEARGIMHKLPWRPHLLSNVAFGHGITATPLQIAAAYSTLANGGMLIRPRLVKALQREGEWVEQKSETLRQVLSPQQASTMTLMLTAATSMTGTGARARIEGYPVAGKTGTAQMVDLEKGGYKKGSYISSFAGFAPAHAPRFVIYIAVDDPKKEYYGSQVAAPVFSRVAQYAIRKIGLPPVLITEKNLMPAASDEEKPLQKQALQKIRDLQAEEQNKMPNLLGLSLREALQRTRGLDLDVQVSGNGWVTETLPRAGEEMGNNKRVKLVLRE